MTQAQRNRWASTFLALSDGALQDEDLTLAVAMRDAGYSPADAWQAVRGFDVPGVDPIVRRLFPDTHTLDR